MREACIKVKMQIRRLLNYLERETMKVESWMGITGIEGKANEKITLNVDRIL